VNEEVELSSNADSYVLSLMGKVNTARSPADFTSEYDEAVDELEDRFVSEAFKAIEVLDIDTAVEKLYQARDLRKQYLDLLEQSASDPEHPMSSAMSNLRAYAIDMDNLRFYLQTVFEAMLEYARGRGSDALRVLDRVETISITDDLDSLLAQNVKIMAENLTGLIRRGVLDFAGARAAYERASMRAQDLLERITELQDNQEAGESAEEDEGFRYLILGAKYSQASNEANSYRMQYSQQMASFDYAGAIDAAHAASEAFLIAADCMAGSFPGFVPFIRASSFAALAEAGIAEANMLLERREWDSASDMIKTVRSHYEHASRECLKSKAPSASTMQESYLNTAFSWMVQFRRELERERSNAARIEELQAELRNFYGSLRGALAPAGVTVNNATEMVTSVKQQVEVTNRVETNIRSLLREIPKALDTTDLPASEKEKLSAEAIQLAEDNNSDRITFFARAGKFAQRLASAISTGAELAAPVVALLKALSVVS
jgi:hypothetical protein